MDTSHLIFLSAIFLFVAAALIFVLLRPRKTRLTSYKVAKAGAVGDDSTPLVKPARSLSNILFNYNGLMTKASDFDDIFLVEGESMAPLGIHTGDGLLTSKLEGFRKMSLKKDDAIIYEIDPTRYNYKNANEAKKVYGFKVRRFLTYIDLSKGTESLCIILKSIDPSLEKDDNAEKLCQKVKKAKEYFTQKNGDQQVIVSITNKNDNSIDYSIHSLSELYGKVEYIIPKKYFV